jgi:hypothetical protein
MDLVAELQGIVRALDAARVPYALCGGIAVVLHGYVRATRDIDLLIPAEHLADALHAVSAFGYDEPALPMTFGANTPEERAVQRVTKLDGSSSLTLDLLLVGPLYEHVWSPRQTYEWEGSQLSAVSLDGLIAMKRIAKRPQDLADIDALEKVGIDGA